MRKPLSQAAAAALRVLLKDPGVGAEIKAFLATPPTEVFDPSDKTPRTLEDVALRGAYDAGYRRIAKDLEELTNARPPTEVKTIHPQSLSTPK